MTPLWGVDVRELHLEEDLHDICGEIERNRAICCQITNVCSREMKKKKVPKRGGKKRINVNREP